MQQIYITSISLNTENVKTTYFIGDTFTSNGLIVTANKNNSTSQVVTPTSINTSNLNTNVAGSYIITVYYGELSQTYTVTVQEIVITGLSLNTEDIKTLYFIGEEFTSNGLIVTANKNNATSEVVTPTSINSSAFNANVTGNYTIIVTYGEFTQNYTVTVAQVAITSISLNTQNVQTNYCIGETFTSAGLIVTASYNNGTSQNIETGYEINSTNFNNTLVDTYLITVNASSVSATYQVTVSMPDNLTLELINVIMQANLAKFQDTKLLATIYESSVYDENGPAYIIDNGVDIIKIEDSQMLNYLATYEDVSSILNFVGPTMFNTFINQLQVSEFAGDDTYDYAAYYNSINNASTFSDLLTILFQIPVQTYANEKLLYVAYLTYLYDYLNNLSLAGEIELTENNEIVINIPADFVGGPDTDREYKAYFDADTFLLIKTTDISTIDANDYYISFVSYGD